MPSLIALARRLRALPDRTGGAILEAVAAVAARRVGNDSRPAQPKSVFVLRNNDVGDVLLATPLLAALRAALPGARITAGIGDWARDVLLGNPNVDDLAAVDAPWFNKYAKPNGPRARLSYLLRSPQVRALQARRFDLGVDVVGSVWGALLLLRAGIPYRMGVSGYAGGSSTFQSIVQFDPSEHVIDRCLHFARLLGSGEAPTRRPQIFLTAEEQRAGAALWRSGRRLVLAPGGGLARKLWSKDSYAELTKLLAGDRRLDVVVMTGPQEAPELADAVGSCGARLLEGLTLRECFALVATADAAVCNSSMTLHVAAAFDKPVVVTLGPSFPSAREHQRQWGYDGLSVSLGREPQAADGLADVQTVLAATYRALALERP